jgi:hypothetical protein
MRAKVISLKQKTGPSPFKYLHFRGLLNGNSHFYQKVVRTSKDKVVTYIAIIKRRQCTMLQSILMDNPIQLNNFDKTNAICEFIEEEANDS